MFANETLTNSTAIEKNILILNRVRLVVKFYLWPLLVIFGLTGNFISTFVLTRRRLIRTSTNNYLTILAVFDSCYLILTLILNFGSHSTFSENRFVQMILSFLRPLADFSSNAATWLIVCFTLERTLAVARPIYAKRTCSVRRSRHLICTLLIFCFLITIPTYLENQFLNNPRVEQTTNQTVSNQKKHNGFVTFHRLYLVFICIFIVWIPLVVLCACNSILIWYVHRSRRFDNTVETSHDEDLRQCSSSMNSIPHEYSSVTYSNGSVPSSMRSSLKTNYKCHLRRHNHSYSQKRKVTIILIFCLFLALILWTPQSLSLTYETLIESFEDMPRDRRILLLIFNNFANLFVCINASIDFILYCFLSENFARTCHQIIFRKCSNYHSKIHQPTRFLSFDRTSLIFGHSSMAHHQQVSLTNSNTNKFYAQIYNRQGSSSMKFGRRLKKIRKPLGQPTAAIIRKPRRLIYQTSLTRNPSHLQLPIPVVDKNYLMPFQSSFRTRSNTDGDCTQSDYDGSLPSLIAVHRTASSDARLNH